MAISVSRRTLLTGLLGTGALGAVTVGAVASGALDLEEFIYHFRLGDEGPPGVIPTAGPGTVTLTTRRSAARGQDVEWFTAVPNGYGDGAGLPVCVITHGASATPARYQGFGLPQFLTQAVLDGAKPFVLVGASGGRTSWLGNGSTDQPQKMLAEEIPQWCDEAGFDASRMALWGWSMGGAGLLTYGESPTWKPRALAAFSPALSADSATFARGHKLAGIPLGLWCGRSDSLYPTVRDFAASLKPAPEIAAFGPGAHTRKYWNRITPEAFAFLSAHLSA